MDINIEDLKMALERAADRLDLLSDNMEPHQAKTARKWAEQARKVLEGLDYDEAHGVNLD
jgi:hypothetical protein